MFNVVSYKLNADNLKKADSSDIVAASNGLHAAEHDTPHHEEYHSHVIGHIAHSVAEGLGVAGKGLHVLHKHLPGVLHHIEHVAEVYAEIAHNETSRDETENVICGTVVGITKIVAGGAAVTVLIIPGLNEIALPFVAEEVGVVIIALSAGATLQHTVDAALKPCADFVKHSCHTAFANYHRFNRELPMPKIRTIDAALRAMQPTDKDIANKKQKKGALSSDSIDYRKKLMSVIKHLKKIAPTRVDADSDMTKALRAIEPSNPVNDERFKCDRKKYSWPEIKSKYEREHQNNVIDEVNAGMQNPALLSCTKARSSHRFVTPNYVSLRELEKTTSTDTFLYVITEKEKLVIAKQEGLLFGESVSHIDLARGKPVFAAGMMQVEQGKVVRIDNQTTDYQYTDNAIAHSNEALMRMFAANGMTDIQDKFVHNVLPDVVTSTQPQPTVAKEEILSEANLYTNPTLPSSSFFTQAKGHQASLKTKAPLHTPDSSIDFAARQAHFNNIIAKGVGIKSPSSRTSFFNQVSASKIQTTAPTFNVSQTQSNSSNYVCPVIKGPQARIGVVLKDGITDWGATFPLTTSN